MPDSTQPPHDPDAERYDLDDDLDPLDGFRPYATFPFSPTASLRWAWTQLRSNVGLMLVLGLLMLGPQAVVQLALGPDDASRTSLEARLELVVGLVRYLLLFVFAVVAASASVAAYRGERPTLRGAFGHVAWPGTALAGLAYAFFVQAGLSLLVLPGLAVAFCLLYGASAVALRPWSAGPTSLAFAFQALTRNVGQSLQLAALAALVTVLGLLALGVGVLLAAPLAVFAVTHSYLTLCGEPGA